jgi:hypothetical protein
MDYALIGRIYDKKGCERLGNWIPYSGGVFSGKTIFSQVVELIHPQQFRRCVAPPIRAPGGSREGT